MKKERKPLTEKQLENLRRGREKHTENLKRKLEVAPVAETDTVPETTPLPAVSQAAPEIPKITKIGGRIWWQVILGCVFFAIAAILAVQYTRNMSNSFIAFAFVLVGGAGVLFTFMGLRKREEGMQLNRFGRKKVVKANCLNIYYGYDENTKKHYCQRVAFEWMERKDIVSETPQQCLDDGKWYYVHIYDGKSKKYIPFFLPDTQYYNPKEFVNPLVMPASRKVLKPVPTLGEKLRPILLVIAIGIMGLIFVVTAPSPESQTAKTTAPTTTQTAHK